jgi:hypothetical protein
MLCNGCTIIERIHDRASPARSCNSKKTNKTKASRERPAIEIEFFRKEQNEVSHLELYQNKERLKAIRKQ